MLTLLMHIVHYSDVRQERVVLRGLNDLIDLRVILLILILRLGCGVIASFLHMRLSSVVRLIRVEVRRRRGTRRPHAVRGRRHRA